MFTLSIGTFMVAVTVDRERVRSSLIYSPRAYAETVEISSLQIAAIPSSNAGRDSSTNHCTGAILDALVPTHCHPRWRRLYPAL
jgi:hypothetical protein